MESDHLDVSVVVPVFNSEVVVGGTVEGICATLRDQEESFEVILVDDGSRDGSWRLLEELAATHPEVRALRLLRNYGQHNANLAGLRATRGEWVVTMDDDGQNPPSEIIPLLRRAREGYDAVFGEFQVKQHGWVRSLGSRWIGRINRRVFGKPPDLVVSNFRALHCRVVDRVCNDGTSFPYITGQALLYSENRANVTVRHLPREHGSSNYNLLRTARLVLTILFSYSIAPLHMLTVIGVAIATASFVTGVIFLVRGVVGDVSVPGWTSLAVLLSFLQGVVILMLSMLGEYVVRTMHQTVRREPYIIAEEAGE